MAAIQSGTYLQSALTQSAFAAHLPLFLYPFLSTNSKTRPFEYLRLTSLGVIGALVKVSLQACQNEALSAKIVLANLHHLLTILTQRWRVAHLIFFSPEQRLFGLQTTLTTSQLLSDADSPYTGQ